MMKTVHKQRLLLGALIGTMLTGVIGYTLSRTNSNYASAEEAPASSPASAAVHAPAGNPKVSTAAESEFTPIKTTKLAAENGKFQLYVSEEDGQVRIRDKTSGKEWYSAPPVDRKIPPNNLRLIEAPVQIKFTEGKSITTTYPSKEKALVTGQPIESGYRFDFDFETIGISFAMEYRLSDTGFELNIPFDSVQERGAVRLTGLELLPYLNATAPGERGAILLPDGSGTLMKFKEYRPNNFDSYSQFVYGGDHAFQTAVYEKVRKVRGEITVNPPKEKIALPVYGLFMEDESAILGIITRGDSDAKINATPSGVRNIPLYRTSAEFMYRNDDVIFIGNSGEIPMIERTLIPGDRTIRYILLQDDQADYVGMAHAYRDYLMKDQGIAPVQDQSARFQLRLVGGVVQDEIIGSTYIPMTTFEQARTIVDRMLGLGVKRIEVTYDAWNDGGKYGNQPEHFPAQDELGGNKELKKLAVYLEQQGISLYLNANYVKPFAGSKELKPKRDAIRGLNNEPMPLFRNWLDTHQMSDFKFYLMKPQHVLEQYIAPEAKKYAELGIDGIHLEWMGELLYSDHTEIPPFRRAQTIDTWRKSLDLVRKLTGAAAVDYGFAYTFGHIDRIDQVPLDSSRFVYTDETVPFYQIALHGLIPYYADTSNNQDDPRVHLLRMLEYGALPSYILTHQPPSDLKRTLYDELLGSEYTVWEKPAAAEYAKVAEVLAPLAGKTIEDHRSLMPKVYQTVYSDGTRIIVNYNRSSVTIDGQIIEPYGFGIRKGGG
ncbi:MAG: hypothetical protein K0R28_3433 [Paenibacillus sp.]|nr:hypothetical protein [Paenibacillus sp.]